IFSLGLKTKPADTPAEFTAAKNVVSVKLRSRATGVFTRQQLNLAAQVKEKDTYVSPEVEGEGGGD
ncbi:MAG: DNA-binding protein, partial [Prevotella sp.]|nr:DNA-binding protein [Prevotella sp.]